MGKFYTTLRQRTISIQYVNYSGTTCKKFCENYYSQFLHNKSIYDPLHSAVHQMRYLESDVMWYTLGMLPIYAQSINMIYSARLFTLNCTSSSGVYLCIGSIFRTVVSRKSADGQSTLQVCQRGGGCSFDCF